MRIKTAFYDFWPWNTKRTIIHQWHANEIPLVSENSFK